MKRTTKGLIVIGLIILFIGLFNKYSTDYLEIKKYAPPGIHGHYSLPDYDPVYKTKYDKDSLLKYLEKDGLQIKMGRLNDYDPPWDSLRYLIDNIRCDTQNIETYIEFRREKQKGYITFRILWINATPNESYDTTLYQKLTKKYFNCFETILQQHAVQIE